MKKLFFGLVVLLAISSCENREDSQEIEKPLTNEKLTIEHDNAQSRDSIGGGSDTGIGPVVTIPPR